MPKDPHVGSFVRFGERDEIPRVEQAPAQRSRTPSAYEKKPDKSGFFACIYQAKRRRYARTSAPVAPQTFFTRRSCALSTSSPLSVRSAARYVSVNAMDFLPAPTRSASR